MHLISLLRKPPWQKSDMLASEFDLASSKGLIEPLLGEGSRYACSISVRHEAGCANAVTGRRSTDGRLSLISVKSGG